MNVKIQNTTPRSHTALLNLQVTCSQSGLQAEEGRIKEQQIWNKVFHVTQAHT